VDEAVEGAMQAKMRNIGEACTAANRFYVQRGVVDEFARKLTERMTGLSIGRGTDENVVVGPLIDEDAVTKVSELVNDAADRGAQVLTGGGTVDGPGNFYQPTVLTEVPAEARVTTEESCGAVAPISGFDTEEEELSRASSSGYGRAS